MSSIVSRIDELITADELPFRLKAALKDGDRRGLVRTRFSPELGYGRHAGPAPDTARAAAVALLLFRRDGRWHLPLTERPLTLAHHAGQISLPGGAIDAGETALAAAERELHEELGLQSSRSVVGPLADCYVFASDFRVTPWVMASFEPRIVWRPHAPEVQRVIELPLEVLLDENAVGRLTIERGPLVFHAPCFRLDDIRVWGATAIILDELAQLLRQLLEKDE
jgi:8-oxo-dGTP pyrophosphatase MutT (NUDIX family)